MISPDLIRETSSLNRLAALFDPIRSAALLYLAAVTLAELVTNLVDPRLGLVLHGVSLLAMLVHATLTTRRGLQRLIFSLTLAPLIRLVSLSLPLVNFEFAYRYMIVGAPLLLAAFVAGQVVKVNFRMAGVVSSRAWRTQFLVGLSGLGLGYLEYLILRPEFFISEFNWSGLVAPALVLLVFTGFLEEYIFRGLMQYTALFALGGFGLVYISALFAALHIGYRSVLDLVFVFSVAIFFSLVAYKTRSILGVTLAHGLANIGLFLIFPFISAALGRSHTRPAESLAATAAPTPGQFSGPALWGAPPTHTFTPTASPTTTPTSASTPSPSLCAPPEDWVAYTVQPGDSLAAFRQIFDLRKSDLLAANCDPGLEEVVPGQSFYLPYLPPTPVPYTVPSETAVQPEAPGERPPPEPPSSRP